MDGACSTCGREKIRTMFWYGNLKERDHSEELGIEEDDIKIDIKELGWEGVKRINLAVSIG